MIRKEYSASAVKHLFWFSEFKKVLQLLADGLSMEEIRQKNRAENLFGCPTERRATQIFNVVSARIRSLNPSFYPVFMRSELSSQKLFALIAAMAYDTLFFYQWCKQVAGLCLTAFLQTTLLFLGLLTFSQNMLLGLGIMLSAKEVPKIAQQFGLDTSAHAHLTSVIHTTSMAIHMGRAIAAK